MGFGSTAKKVQKLADTAEKLYSKLNELREQVAEMREKLDSTSERVERLEQENAHQRALLEALAEEEGIDVDDIEVEPVASDDEQAAEA
jgi:septal ring factor EnvC (AmiA/AmiB activator)